MLYLEKKKGLLDAFLNRKRWFPTNTFSEENSKSESLLCFLGYCLELFPLLIFLFHKYPKDILATTFQAVRQKDNEKEEVIGKKLFDSSSPFL